MTTMWYEEPDNSRLTKRANVCTPQCVVEKLDNADTSTDGYLEFFHGKAEAFFYEVSKTLYVEYREKSSERAGLQKI
jgi:hypothetical protein